MKNSPSSLIPILAGTLLSAGVIITAFILIMLQANGISAQKENIQASTADIQTLATTIPSIDIATLALVPFDGNNDGINEYMGYFHKTLAEPAQWNGALRTWMGAYALFTQRNGTWEIALSGEGTRSPNNTGFLEEIDERLFFYAQDLDQNGTDEAIVMLNQIGNGGYVTRRILAWDEDHFIEAPIHASQSEEELTTAFLSENETLGSTSLTSTFICPQEDMWCSIRASAPNAVGKITFDLVFSDGVFTQEHYTRENL